jgi:hypothetical protein
VEIALLVAEPNMSFAAVNQNDFILDQMPVLRYAGAGGNVLDTSDEMLRAVIFRLTFSMNWEEAEAVLSV